MNGGGEADREVECRGAAVALRQRHVVDGDLRVVVEDRARARAVDDELVGVGIAQMDVERLVRLDLGVAEHLDRDRLLRFAWEERDRSAAGHVVEVDQRGAAVGRGIVDGQRHAERSGGDTVLVDQADGEHEIGGAAVAFELLDVVDRDVRIVVENRTLPVRIGDNGVRRTAQPGKQDLVRFDLGIAVDVDDHRLCEGAAGVEGQHDALGNIVAVGERGGGVVGIELHGYGSGGVCRETHGKLCLGGAAVALGHVGGVIDRQPRQRIGEDLGLQQVLAGALFAQHLDRVDAAGRSEVDDPRVLPVLVTTVGADRCVGGIVEDQAGVQFVQRRVVWMVEGGLGVDEQRLGGRQGDLVQVTPHAAVGPDRLDVLQTAERSDGGQRRQVVYLDLGIVGNEKLVADHAHAFAKTRTGQRSQRCGSASERINLIQRRARCSQQHVRRGAQPLRHPVRRSGDGPVDAA